MYNAYQKLFERPAICVACYVTFYFFFKIITTSILLPEDNVDSLDNFHTGNTKEVIFQSPLPFYSEQTFF